MLGVKFLQDIDEYTLYYGKDFIVSKYIHIRQPINQEILDYGESKFLSAITRFCYTPSDMKSELYDNGGINWQDMDDYDLFLILYKAFDPDDYSIIFGKQIFFKELELFINNSNGQKFLAYELPDGQPNMEDVIIDKLIYMRITTALRSMYKLKRNHDIAANKYTMKYLIDEDRRKKNKYKNSDVEFESIIMPLIITSANTVECKYNADELLDIGFYRLITDLDQISKSKSALALIQGQFSGMIDTSKIDKSNFNWMYESSKKQL